MFKQILDSVIKLKKHHKEYNENLLKEKADIAMFPTLFQRLFVEMSSESQ